MSDPIDKLVPPGFRTDKPFIVSGAKVIAGNRVLLTAADGLDSTAEAIADALNVASRADAAYMRGLMLRLTEQRERAERAEEALRQAKLSVGTDDDGRRIFLREPRPAGCETCEGCPDCMTYAAPTSDDGPNPVPGFRPVRLRNAEHRRRESTAMKQSVATQGGPEMGAKNAAKKIADKRSKTRTVKPPKANTSNVVALNPALTPEAAERIKAGMPVTDATLADAPKIGDTKPLAPKKARERRQLHIAFEQKDLERCRTNVGESGYSEITQKTDDELWSYLQDLAVHEEETEVAKKADDGLKDARATVAELNAPYRDTLKGIKQRRRLVVSELQTRGKLTR